MSACYFWQALTFTNPPSHPSTHPSGHTPNVSTRQSVHHILCEPKDLTEVVGLIHPPLPPPLLSLTLKFQETESGEADRGRIEPPLSVISVTMATRHQQEISCGGRAGPLQGQLSSAVEWAGGKNVRSQTLQL